MPRRLVTVVLNFCRHEMVFDMGMYSVPTRGDLILCTTCDEYQTVRSVTDRARKVDAK